MKNGKRILAAVLIVLMLVTAVPLTSLQAHAYSVNDHIEFGSYPQTRVEETAALKKAAASAGWKSYKYYSGTGNITDGNMKSEDYMWFTDFFCGSTKYRAVRIDDYRPQYTGSRHNKGDAWQQVKNGYVPENTYYFKYEPLTWRILDPTTGYVMCENIIDSQPTHNTCYAFATNHIYKYYQDKSTQRYAIDYAASDMRTWLNKDFYETAFTDVQKANIKVTALNNDSLGELAKQYNSSPTNDKMFLLSYGDTHNEDYGFKNTFWDETLKSKGTEYAKCQGLGADKDGFASWLLRTPYNDYLYMCYVSGGGHSGADRVYTFSTTCGTRPACCLSVLKNDPTISTNLFSGKGVPLKSTDPPKVSIKSNTHGTLTIGIKAVEGATNYQVQYKKKGDKNYSTKEYKVGTTLVKINLTPGATYYVRVRAYAKDGRDAYFTKFTKDKAVKIFQGKSLTDAKIILSKGKKVTYIYNGKAQKPAVTVKLGMATLKAATDYTVYYKNNTNAGIASVTVIGKGNYFDSATKKFRIEKRMIDDSTVQLSKTSFAYTGKKIRPKVTVSNPVTITTKDYDVIYKNNINIGNATVTIKGTRNFQGSITKTFKIRQASISTAAVTLESDTFTYTGKKICPAVTVNLKGVILAKDKDYTVAYKNNVNEGMATVTVTGIGNMTGTVLKSFNIVLTTSYDLKVEAFINDPRWKDGINWGENQRPKLSKHDSWSCCAYAADFVKFVFNKDSQSSGTPFHNANEIQSGDVLHFGTKTHWFVILYRNDSQLTTAEGNWGGKVIISDTTYKMVDGEVYRINKRGDYEKFRTFDIGYHYDINSVK